MKNFEYSMPVKLYIGKDSVLLNSTVFGKFGKKALIVTGRSSAYKNGAISDCVKVLDENGTEYKIFDETEENPSLETVSKAAQIGRDMNADFCIGIGGGSPLDAAKAIGILIMNKDVMINDLFDPVPLKSVPLIAVPTTAGTGSETTPYSILTIHEKKTKQGLPHRIFFDAAFVDAKYTLDMPKNITINTAVDALTHLIESYLCKRANILSDRLCETGFDMFRGLKKDLFEFELGFEQRESLLIMSSIAGMCIAQTGSSLPHAMGYPLTYFNGLPHGAANGLLTERYLKLCDKKKTEKMLDILGYKTISEFGEALRGLLNVTLKLTENEITRYTDDIMGNKNKLAAHPFPVIYEDIEGIYRSFI